jgi:hypothetical protein
MKIVRISHPPVRSVKGRGLACRKLSKPGRALLGVDIIEGTTSITDLSHKQIAATVGVSLGYLNAALRLTAAEREAVRRGLRPLVEPRAPAAQPAAQPAARERLAAIVDEIGVDATMALLAGNERVAA